MKFAQLVIGTAGAGKSTYCSNMLEYMASLKRTVHVMNLDPAADALQYDPSIDVRDVITVSQVMEDRPELGPNGALVLAMEEVSRDYAYLEETLGDYSDDYLIIDCPGQIELFTHLDVMGRLSRTLEGLGYRVAAVYLSESTFISDPGALVYSALAALSAMLALGIPHINLLSKVDLLADDMKKSLSGAFPDPHRLVSRLNMDMPMFSTVNDTIAELVADYSMIQYYPLDYTDDDTLLNIVAQLDHMLQFYDDAEVGGADFNEDPE
ncbi:ATP-binding family protein [Carpediemonas membranifera]|uniref:GPN-loop GTPase 3 n=1 Tax=Carpediemonas membranifera TaxID=201153 RepID=A0A8J6BYU3_9EUKA|nr:ATP-binding family protein [Carpediemonas membranifera]|eukprot:KAG9394881.1 ATP-binding family protein [Carpediemonas membranifera]